MRVIRTTVKNSSFLKFTRSLFFLNFQANTDVVVGGSSAQGSFVEDRLEALCSMVGTIYLLLYDL